MTSTTVLTIQRSPDHAFPGHPESPRRFDNFEQVFGEELQPNLERVELTFDETTILENIHLVHQPDYVTGIRDAMARAPLFLDYGDTYATPQSYTCALQAVAGTLAAFEPIQTGQIQQAFALVRPPGHHANQHQAGGFCIFNNIAIAAKNLQENGYAKIAIVDFDVHHGNGTQDIFENDPDVLYISTHQWGIYPGTGRKTEIGIAEGEGSIINIPLPAYCGDRGFLKLFEQIIQPAVSRFQPDCMLVSAGFDAHWSDPLANLQLSTSGYHHLSNNLRSLAMDCCEGRLGFVLEGGYDPQTLADNIAAVLYALSNRELPEDRLGSAPVDEPSIDALLEEIRSIHSL
jgi:acetoin utilization deacetylase AcuC-like enzyme